MRLDMMSDFKSLKFALIRSLTLWSALLLVPILGVVAIAIKINIDRHLAEEQTEFARAAAYLIADQLPDVSRVPPDQEMLERLQRLLDFLQDPEGEELEGDEPDYYQRIAIRLSSGQLLVVTPETPPGFFDDVSLSQGFSETNKGMFFTQSLPQRGLVVQFSKDSHEALFILAEIMGLVLLGILLLVPTVILAGNFMAQTLQNSVTRFVDDIEARSVENLVPLDSSVVFSEARPAIQSINRLMSKLKKALRLEREFSANVAHELRTPLAVILAQAQRMKKTDNVADCQQKAREIEHSAKRAAHLIDRLLQLSRVERQIGRVDVATDVNEILQLLASDFNRHPAYENRVTAQLSEEPVMIKVDEDAFGIIISNLLENALRYSPEGSEVTLEQSNASEIRIRNDCEVFEIDPRKEIRARSAKGLGLGITISTLLAEQSGLDLSFASPIPGSSRGLEARLVVKESKTADAV
jgi:two-component system OmpR family sensor kinase